MRFGLGIGMTQGDGGAGVVPPPAVPSSVFFPATGGTQRMILTTPVQFDGATPVVGDRTVTLWMRYNQDAASGPPGLVCFNNYGDNTGLNIYMAAVSAGTVGVRMRINGSNQAGSAINFPTNAWRHYALRSYLAGAGNGYRHYINNVGANAATARQEAQKWDQIGRRSTSSSFMGNICEITLWNKLLSDAEVAALCPGGVFADPMDPAFDSYGRLGYWKCGVGDAFPTILDRIGTNHLTMDGGLSSASFVADHP